ncbi:uncharacterized protein LOC128553251 [Mercenaria mercenaria]|uniref:uncharacterized protein LOC128553251 n=1 Tax=Mercenaria mercenaria TaxID=6596 RepID=UPI00234EC1FF|nr:uncharacterized protein LOC128553251 [Mercenaria mercenaria]
MSSKFSCLSLEQLRKELRRRNAKLSGRKKELIERLEAYERNHNFVEDYDTVPEYFMDLPPSGKYKDLNSDMKIPPVTNQCASDYMSQFGVDFDRVVCDLYEETFIRYVRYCSTEDLDYIKGACYAEMKKKVSYTIDISVKKNGQFHEAQCECGAGQGPTAHCKHVRTILFACCKFTSSGKLKVEMTCTEKLQSFHKVKKHTGSPLKSRDMNIAGADEICDIKMFDPRPQEFQNRENYKDYFYNTCMNFKGISKTPIFQAFQPANMRAYALDHDYQSDTLEDIFLNAIQVTKISKSQRETLEVYTRGQEKNERWFEEREKRIQSSNYHRICHATERTNHDQLAASLVHPNKLKQNEAMKHAHKYEKEAIHRHEKDNKVKVNSCGIFVSSTHPYLGASPDGVVNQTLIVEVKCPLTAKNKDINTKSVPYLTLTDGKN